MAVIPLPYGKKKIAAQIPDARLAALVESKLSGYAAPASEAALVASALARPIGSRPLAELAKGKRSITVISSDHTRPVPSAIIMPLILKELRAYNPDADITILVATGCHRETTRDELAEKYGEEIAAREKIVVHDCDDEANLVSIGTLPSGGPYRINRAACEADLLVAEGFIEPHFFAGFSGGRKSVLPGVASRDAVLANHCAEFIAHPLARTGMLEGNPIHRDMVWAARKAGLRFLVNVVLDANKRIIHAVAGDAIAAHESGCAFLDGLCRAQAPLCDIALATNGGYPLDQNAYQAVKGMTAAESCVKKGGVIIMLAQCGDGVGGEAFYNQLANESDIGKTLSAFMSRRRDQTEPDQWQTQIFLRVLARARVILVSDLDEETVRGLHMTPARSVAHALELADAMLGRGDGAIAVIPDGVSTIVCAPPDAR